MFISLLAVIINSAILMLSSEKVEEMINGVFDDDYSYGHKVMTLVVIEHIIFLIVFFLSKFIKDKPRWLTKVYKT